MTSHYRNCNFTSPAGMGDIEGLMERVKDLNMDEDKMMDDIKKGRYTVSVTITITVTIAVTMVNCPDLLFRRFTLRNMYEQFQNIMKLGPISQVLDIIVHLPVHLYTCTPVHLYTRSISAAFSSTLCR